MRKFQPEDMKYINYLSDVAISPSGEKTAYVSAIGDEETGLFPMNIYLYREGSAEPEKLVAGRHPLFADDQTLLYISEDNQICKFNFQRGQSTKLTTARHGVTRFSFAAGKIVFELNVFPEDLEKDCVLTEMTSEETSAWDAYLDMKPYIATDLTYKMDEWHGMRHGELPQLATVSIDGTDQKLLSASRELTIESILPTISRDGTKIAFYGFCHTGAKGRQAEAFVCDFDGSNMEQVTEGSMIYSDAPPQFTDGGKSLIVMEFAPFEDGSSVMVPYKVDLASKEKTMLFDEWDEDICNGVHVFPSSRTEYGSNKTYWQIDVKEEYIYFISSFKGRENIYRKSINDTTKIELVAKGEGAIRNFDMAEDGKISCLMGDFYMPAELYKTDVATGKLTRLAHSNDWLDQFEKPEIEEFWVPTDDGKEQLQVWLVHPAGQEDDRLYPAVLYIRGGPECTSNRDYWHEYQALAGAGMAVIYTNPRGATGYGRKFCANGIAWMPEAMDDLVTAVNACVAKGFIDKERIGVTGGSYGGYMTNKFIGRTNHFAAAVSQRSLINPATSYGTGDMGFISANPDAKNVKMYKYLEDRARGNAITYIDNMKVPLLLLHGYEDYRCSFEQAEQLFVAMKDRNSEVPVKLVMFPKENHGVSRSGKLYNQIKHLSELTGWFVKYLEKGAGKDE